MGKKMTHADELILISRCVYGTYSPFVRNILDCCLLYIHPNFIKRANEIHHKPRYRNSLQISVYFYGECTEGERNTTVKKVKANVLNFNGTLKCISFWKDKEEKSDENYND